MSTKHMFIVTLLILTSALSAYSAELATFKKPNQIFRVYGHADYFEWKEYDNDDDQLLKESGPLFGFGGSANIRVLTYMKVKGNIDLFGGQVDYDGAIQYADGHTEPHKSHTTYYGGEGNATVGLLIPMGNRVDGGPYGGIGARLWQRQLAGEYGYDEDWTTVYGQAGFDIIVYATPRFNLFADASLRYPFYNNVRYDMSNVNGPDDLEAEPGKEMTLYAETGFSYALFTMSIFYEPLRFKKSDEEHRGYMRYWQPKSEASIVGLKAGMTF